jgi:hypothetical protein
MVAKFVKVCFPIRNGGAFVTPDDIIQYFKSRIAAADALDVRPQAVSNWVSAGKVPPLRQLQAQSLTRGKLKADPDVYDTKRGQAA